MEPHSAPSQGTPEATAVRGSDEDLQRPLSRGARLLREGVRDGRGRGTARKPAGTAQADPRLVGRDLRRSGPSAPAGRAGKLKVVYFFGAGKADGDAAM